MSLQRDKATANPSKAFFVRMLTRDIALEDCILDLVDNSIDGAWEHADKEPNELVADDALSAYHIEIGITADSFVITDNCGGITLGDAADYAFTFGRRDDQEQDDYSVGVYGIGMKRAVFKIGSSIRIRSTYTESGSRASFQVPINVPEWMAKDSEPRPDGTLPPPNWDFDIEEDTLLAEDGVVISIGDLTEDTSARLADPAYARKLRRILGRDYMVPLMRGLRISVNGVAVSGYRIEFRQSEDFEPMRHKYTDRSVTVELLAGMVSEPPDTTEPDESDKQEDPSGWYVLCNGRVVLAFDKTSLTGWGAELPKWHRQYSGFIGVVLFSAARAIDLPMTTTKRSVDVSSGVYRRALVQMFDPTRAWIDYTNARKADLERAKEREREASTTKDLVNVPANPAVVLPKPAAPVSKVKVGNINFARPVKEIRALAKGFGDDSLTYRDVGIRAFEFAYDELAEES
jgi:hypothetical protein